MGIAALIVGGIVLMTLIASIGDAVSKVAQAKVKAHGEAGARAPQEEIEALHRRINALETRVEEREDAVRKLQEDMRFVSRMLEDKTAGRSPN
jgi:predicted RNase H-like nuclease (RuvC/YqgF family)